MRSALLIYSTLFVLLSGTISLAASNKDRDFVVASCAAGLETNNFRIEKNGFIIGRMFKDYDRQSAGFISAALRRFLAGDHWLDAGTGDAKAILEFLGLWSKDKRYYSLDNELSAIGKGARATGISYRLPETDHGKKIPRLARKHPRFRYLHGQFIKDMDLSGLPRSRLITDIYGPLSYTESLKETFDIYRRQLTDDGELVFLLEDGYNQVILNGEPLPLELWLAERFKDCGLERRVIRDSYRFDEDFLIHAFRWSKQDMEKCVFPDLEMTSINPKAPPKRTFEVRETFGTRDRT